MTARKTKADIWVKKYYPTPAAKCPKSKALEHSVRKWEGLQKSVLRDYGLTLAEGVLWAPAYRTGTNDDCPAYNVVLQIDAGSCSLCHHYMPEDEDDDCLSCPLFNLLGKRCDDFGEDDARSLYMRATRDGDMAAMLNALKKAVVLNATEKALQQKERKARDKAKKVKQQKSKK